MRHPLRVTPSPHHGITHLVYDDNPGSAHVQFTATSDIPAEVGVTVRRADLLGAVLADQSRCALRVPHDAHATSAVTTCTGVTR